MNRSEYDNSTKEEVWDALEEAEGELEEANDRADSAQYELDELAAHVDIIEASQQSIKDFHAAIRAISELKRAGGCYSAELNELIYESIGVIV